MADLLRWAPGIVMIIGSGGLAAYLLRRQSEEITRTLCLVAVAVSGLGIVSVAGFIVILTTY